MTFDNYILSCNQFAEDTADWAALDPYKQYVAVGGGGWVETCDNAENGIDVSWAFGLPSGSINCNEAYVDAFQKEYEQGVDEGWDAEQMRRLFEKYEDCVVNRAGVVFFGNWDAIVERMDDELREQIHMALSPCTNQEFFTTYEKAHEKKFGEPWALSADIPNW